jgi:SNF2 family DNA or RNA helicase
MRSYQVDGAQWIYKKLKTGVSRGVLLCDDVGLGKTRQALIAADLLQADRILVLCPAGARRVWRSEITKWFPDWAGRVLLIEGNQLNSPKDQTLLNRDKLILILGYDAISLSGSGFRTDWVRVLVQKSWDLLICDEAHYLKNNSARSLGVFGRRGTEQGIQASAEHVLLLTATPTPNHAGEIYHACRTLWPWVTRQKKTTQGTSVWHDMSQAEFEERVTEFRDTSWGRQIIRSKNQPWLRRQLQGVVLRRRKAEVLKDLPPIRTHDVALLTDATTLRAGLTPETRALESQILAQANALTDENFLARLRRVGIEAGAPIATLRRELGEAKVSAAVEWITERLFCGVNKLLIFGWHLSVLTHLHRALGAFDPVIITGETSPQGRVAAIDLFQHRPTVRVFVGQILACGTSITLTAASEVAILEPSWVPGENLQAIGRAHRLGQKDSVLATFLYAPDTLDERIMQTFRRKAEDIAQLWEQPKISGDVT